eukprot:SAG22_NODE_13460_length_405_cov_7.715686_1_plen_85_part_10
MEEPDIEAIKKEMEDEMAKLKMKLRMEMEAELRQEAELHQQARASSGVDGDQEVGHPHLLRVRLYEAVVERADNQTAVDCKLLAA